MLLAKSLTMLDRVLRSMAVAFPLSTFFASLLYTASWSFVTPVRAFAICGTGASSSSSSNSSMSTFAAEYDSLGAGLAASCSVLLLFSTAFAELFFCGLNFTFASRNAFAYIRSSLRMSLAYGSLERRNLSSSIRYRSHPSIFSTMPPFVCASILIELSDPNRYVSANLATSSSSALARFVCTSSSALIPRPVHFSAIVSSIWLYAASDTFASSLANLGSPLIRLTAAFVNSSPPTSLT